MSNKLYYEARGIVKDYLEGQYIGFNFQPLLKDFLNRSVTIYYAGQGYNKKDLLCDAEAEWAVYLGSSPDSDEE